jgi:hypothetical protein
VAYTNSSATATLANGLYAYQDTGTSGFGATHFITVTGGSGLITAVNNCSGGGFSDRKLKKDIKLVGKSKKGINIYEFRFINDIYKGLWQGVMADEVKDIHPNLVSKIAGYDYVNYGEYGLDVEFKQIGK